MSELVRHLKDIADSSDVSPEWVHKAEDAIAAIAELERHQRILDSRPAINAALPESYIAWSQSIYVMETRPSPLPCLALHGRAE